MEIESVDYRELSFSRLFCDYIEGQRETSAFYARDHKYDELKKAIRSHHFKGNRKESAKRIRDFNSRFTLDKKAREHLDALDKPDTVTIATGQQLSLLGGPLYTLFKTLTVIHLARTLTRDTGKTVVPVFWLADEDHDYEEIARVTLPGRQEPESFTLPCDGCSRHAAGSLTVDSGFETFRSEVYEHLPETDFRDELIALIDASYTSGRTFRDAFGELLARLFSRHGLIFAGSNFKEAKKQVTDHIRFAIENAETIRRGLEKQSESIAQKYHQQARINDSLLFWHDDTHGRVRLIHRNGSWHREPDVTVTTEELLHQLETEPERFSPNVFFRPIIQDALLPNAAYVGGPAEIAYYGQMLPVYEQFDQQMPFIAARLSATIIEPSVNRSLKELPFRMSDFAGRLEELEQNYLRKHGDPGLDERFDSWKQEIESMAGSKMEEIGISDPGLQKHGRAITREYLKAIDKLRKKTTNMVRQKEEVQINRIRKTKQGLFPNNNLQEREISFIHYMNKFGPDIWERVLERMDAGNNPLFLHHYLIKL